MPRPLDECGRGPTAAEFFLDFDPVLPGWPPQGEAPAHGAPHVPEYVVITVDDFRRLKAAIREARGGRLGAYLNPLERKLRRARIVPPADVSADVVTMNSTVRVFDAVSRGHAAYTLVYPRHAGDDPRAVSVLSLLGTAILGHRAGEAVGAATPHGPPRFTIEKVLYQPEAQGDLHL